MAYQCGPFQFDIRPPDASFVEVTTWTGAAVNLASPIVVDGEGRISFQVYDAGRYKVYVTTADRVYTKSYIIEAVDLALDPDSEAYITQSQLVDALDGVQEGGPPTFNGHKIFITDLDPELEAAEGDVWIPIP